VTLPLPSTVKDPATQECLDAIARQFPIAGANLTQKTVSDKNLAKPTLAGAVKANGEKESGEGFTSEKTALGAYKITLSTELASAGVAVAIAYGGAYARSTGTAQKVFEIFTAVPNTGAQVDSAFGFMIKAT